MSKGSLLFKNNAYLNKNFNYIKGTIREFDMKSAGLSIIKSKKLLDENTINKLEELPKFERNKKIGIMKINNRVLSQEMQKGFREYRQKCFAANNIEDKDIISIHNDAIITINKGILYDKFDYVRFVEKNRYTSYFYINKVEFYFNSMTKKLDVKGISDEKLKSHKKYMIKFLKNIFYLIEMGNVNESIIYLKKFADKYRKRKLDVGYYRELNDKSEFKFTNINIMNSNFYINFGNENTIDYIDINYNYIAYIVNLAKLIYK